VKSKHGFETTEERSKLMSKIRGTNTRAEIALRKALWACGVRYRLNVSNLPGKPDIVIRKSKIVIFVDGEFWHGFKWKRKKPKIKSNRDYWIPKIERTIKRDKNNNTKLSSLGYAVFGFGNKILRKTFQIALLGSPTQ
jgi:DNA mismatch endonuclease (patch repair protein)